MKNMTLLTRTFLVTVMFAATTIFAQTLVNEGCLISHLYVFSTSNLIIFIT